MAQQGQRGLQVGQVAQGQVGGGAEGAVAAGLRLGGGHGVFAQGLGGQQSLGVDGAARGVGQVSRLHSTLHGGTRSFPARAEVQAGGQRRIDGRHQLAVGGHPVVCARGLAGLDSACAAAQFNPELRHRCHQPHTGQPLLGHGVGLLVLQQHTQAEHRQRHAQQAHQQDDLGAHAQAAQRAHTQGPDAVVGKKVAPGLNQGRRGARSGGPAQSRQ